MGPAQGRVLAEELRYFRECMDLPAHVLAHRLGWSQSRLSRVEHGLIPVSEIDVLRYVAHCEGSAEMTEAFVELFRDPGAPGYWLSKRAHTLIFHENTAASSSSYDPLVVPGLLQTQEYVAALIGDDNPWLVRQRMERQLLLGTRPFEFFIHEQALRLPVGGNQVMNEQLLKLVLIAEQPTISLRVVPMALGARSMFGGEFVLFRYPRHEPLVYLDHEESGLFLDGEEHVSIWEERLAGISAVALGREESREMLAAMASDFDRPEAPDAPDDVAEEQLQQRT
jgi:transcriptional regulator with XRE-family HTH domain